MTPYHDPEKFGLELVGDIDFGHEYEFDIVAVFRDQHGRLAYLADTGCSCPMPFEGAGVDDLTYCTVSELQAELTEHVDPNTLGELSRADLDRNKAAIVELMKRVVA